MHDRIFYQVETIDLVLDSHIEWSSDRTLFLITMNRYVLVVTTISKLVNQCWVTMECKDYRFVCCKDCIVFTVAKTVWMFVVRLKFEQVNDIDNTNLKFWKLITKDGNCCHGLKCWSISTACHNDIRLFAFVVTCPLPDANTLCAVLNSLFHA